MMKATQTAVIVLLFIASGCGQPAPDTPSLSRYQGSPSYPIGSPSHYNTENDPPTVYDNGYVPNMMDQFHNYYESDPKGIIGAIASTTASNLKLQNNLNDGTPTKNEKLADPLLQTAIDYRSRNASSAKAFSNASETDRKLNLKTSTAPSPHKTETTSAIGHHLVGQDSETSDPRIAYVQSYRASLLQDGEEWSGIHVGIDQTQLTINSSVSFDVEIWAQSEACHKCDLMYITRISGDSTESMLVNCTYKTELRLFRVHPGGHLEQMSRFHLHFLEAGDYWLFVDYPESTQSTLYSCELMLVNDPSVGELPILYVLIGLLTLAICYVASKRLYRYFRQATAHRRDSMDVTSVRDGGDVLDLSQGSGTAKEGDQEEVKAKRPRLRSLDTFRGLTLILMIFVNYGGGHYWFFEHAPWNGLYVADLVFPWFVFIMGVSINFSFKSMLGQGWSSPKLVWRLVWRSGRLFAVGFMLGTHHWQADMKTVRILGVLQRLALTYLISSLVHYCCVRKFDTHQDRKWAPVRDLVLYLPEWGVNLVILSLHLGIIYGLPVPGCPTGYVGPGGLSEAGAHWNCTGGATQYVDSLILGTSHMYQWPTPQVIYQTTVPFDPEGLLGTLGCVFLCFLGIQCGRIIQTFQDHKQRVVRFLVWAAVLGALAAFLTKCTQDEGWIPPNKNLWSLSYTLITACFAFVLLSAFYVLIDVLQVWQGQPFLYPGMNSIVVYCCSEIFYKQFPVSWVVPEGHWQLLLMCVWASAVWTALAYWMFLKKIFIAL